MEYIEIRKLQADGKYDREKYIDDFVRFINDRLEITTFPLPSYLADSLVIFAEMTLRGYRVDNNDRSGEGRDIDSEDDEIQMPPLLIDVQILKQSVQKGALMKKIKLLLPSHTAEVISMQVLEEWQRIREGRRGSKAMFSEGKIVSVRCSACLKFLRRRIYALRECGCVSTSLLSLF
jgi:hypothetical protein